MYQVLSLLSYTLERSGFYNVGIMSQVFKKSPGEGVAGSLGCTLYIFMSHADFWGSLLSFQVPYHRPWFSNQNLGPVIL